MKSRKVRMMNKDVVYGINYEMMNFVHSNVWNYCCYSYRYHAFESMNVGNLHRIYASCEVVHDDRRRDLDVEVFQIHIEISLVDPDHQYSSLDKPFYEVVQRV